MKYHNYKNKKRNIIIQITKPVILVSYIMITNNYVQHDVKMHLLPVFFPDTNSCVHKPYIIHIDTNCNSIYLLPKHGLLKFLVLFSINSTIGVILNAFNKSDILARN